MSFKNLPIVKKLALGFGTVLLVVFLNAGLVLKQTSILAETERLAAAAGNVVDLVDQLSTDAATASAAGYKMVISGDQIDASAYRTATTEFHKDFDAVKDILDKDAPQFATKFLDVKTAVVNRYFDRFLETQTALARDHSTRDQAFASVVSRSSVEAREAYEASLSTFRDAIVQWSETVATGGRQALVKTELVVVVASGVTLIVGLFMAWFIAKSVGGPLNHMTATMQALANGDNAIEVPAREQTDEVGAMARAVQVFKVAAIEKIRLETEAEATRRAAQTDRERAEAARALAARQQADVVDQIAGGLNKLAGGDLLHHIGQPFAPEYESLRTDFNAAVIQLHKTIKEVFNSTGTISSGTGEISTASDDLSRRTEQQAASLEETAAALAEITSAMKRTAEGAIHARKVVGSAQSTVDQSNEVVARTITAMGNIEKASHQISQIIGVIDEIAFQTNLLALNAGVEAARAGEAGRGFAVVASEVRGLAQRCAEAAREVKTLVLSSEQQVKAGVELVGHSGTMLEKIVGQVAELTAIVNDIAGSAETQSVGLSEINLAIRQMDQVTQQNAAMAEEATAAARNLAHESVELVRLVGRFNVSEEASAPAARSAAPPPASRAPVKKVAVAASSGARPQAATGSDNWDEF